ncbi:MAG: hypothetical protein FWG88_04200 [Oscillospiraceae bacterium]|nr:hypothetical protein [Oscillospiraceae bacterium]
MFDITKTDIQKLNDGELRDLIGRLCESEMELNRLSRKNVIWGGAQTATDDGIDITVKIDNQNNVLDGFICNRNTVIQVKRYKMEPSKITNEMDFNKDKLWEILKKVNDKAGMYIIVSGADDANLKMLNARKNKMKDILSKKFLNEIEVDFYDSQKIASWANSFPSEIAWVKNKVDITTQHWKPYENWSNDVNGKDLEYIIDDKNRIEYNGSHHNIEDGIKTLRSLLQLSGKSIRIIGLSGVGKTRFVQALFDDRIGDDSLPITSVLYTNYGHSPSPSPLNMAAYFYNTRKTVTLIIDNCSYTLHKSLTEICTQQNSTVNIVTVEYDISEGEPEETEFFRLGLNSDAVIEKLLHGWYDDLSSSIITKIIELAGGNARLAKLLYEAIKNHEYTDSFTDKVFFNRLFWQNNSKDDELQRVAEACSLVYAFDMEDNNELEVLANIADVSIKNFRRRIKELRKREILQERSTQRAILPHALANYLVKETLSYFELPDSKFFENSNKRLLYSFIRRLSYLYEDDKAIGIAQELICSYEEPNNFQDKYDIEAFCRLATIVPKEALKIIEDNVSNFLKIYYSLDNYTVRIVAYIAYEAELFARSVDLLIAMYLNCECSESLKILINQRLVQLFRLYGSGTNATPEQRMRYVKSLLKSDNYTKQELGMKLLKSALSTRNHSTGNTFTFSQHQRDEGYWPSTEDEDKNWYSTFLQLFEEAVCSETFDGCSLLEYTSIEWNLLFEKTYLSPVTLAFVKKIRSICFWPEGLLSVKFAMNYLKNHLDQQEKTHNNRVKDNLMQIESILTHDNDLEFIMLLQSANHYDLSKYGYLPKNEVEAEKIIIEKAIFACADTSFNAIFMRSLVCKSNNHSFTIGRGLCIGCKDRKLFLSSLINEYTKTPSSITGVDVLQGFLHELVLIDEALLKEVLQRIQVDDNMRRYYPSIISQFVGDFYFDDLIEKVSNCGFSARFFDNVWRGRGFKSLTNEQHSKFYNMLYRKVNGAAVAIRLFHDHLCLDMKDSKLQNEYALIGQHLLLEYEYNDPYTDHIDYNISIVFKSCFIDDSENLKTLYRNIYTKFNENHSIFYPHLINELITLNPFLFLDVFLCDGQDLSHQFTTMKNYDLYSSMLDSIDSKEIIHWVELNIDERCAKIVNAIRLFYNEDNVAYWKPIVYEIFSMSSNPHKIVKLLLDTLIPKSWDGSLADILNSRLPLIQAFKEHEISDISIYANEFENGYITKISAVRKWEKEKEEEERKQYNKFE